MAVGVAAALWARVRITDASSMSCLRALMLDASSMWYAMVSLRMLVLAVSPVNSVRVWLSDIVDAGLVCSLVDLSTEKGGKGTLGYKRFHM